MALKISISGARGIVGEDLVPEFLQEIFVAFAKHIPEGKIFLSGDSRPSGEPLRKFASAVFQLLGRDVLWGGILPTPTSALCTKHFACAGGVIITASHNPPEWNGIKLLNSDGIFIEHTFWQEVSENHFRNNIKWANYLSVGKSITADNCPQIHIEKITRSSLFSIDAVRNSGIKVAYDGVAGAGPVTIIPLFETLGVEYSAIGDVPDGNFPHSPEPVPENLKMLGELVRSSGADIGFATDPDADRLAVVDEHGNPIGEEFTLALTLYYVLSKSPGDVVVNLSTSTMVDFVADKFGARVHRTPVGEYWVVKRILEVGAVGGGEGNGGVIVPEVHPVRDSAVGVAAVLSLMAETQKPVSELVRLFPKKVMLKDKIPARDFPAIKEKILSAFAPKEPNLTDGVWFATGGGFVHIRPSNTEPIIRIIVEDETEQSAQRTMEKIKDVIGTK